MQWSRRPLRELKDSTTNPYSLRSHSNHPLEDPAKRLETHLLRRLDPDPLPEGALHFLLSHIFQRVDPPGSQLNGVTALVVAEDEAGRRMPFAFLADLHRRFTTAFTMNEIADAPAFGMASFEKQLAALVVRFSSLLSLPTEIDVLFRRRNNTRRTRHRMRSRSRRRSSRRRRIRWFDRSTAC